MQSRDAVRRADHLFEPDVAQAALEWMARDNIPKLFVTRDLDVVWANDVAYQLLQPGLGVCIRSGQLSCNTASNHKALLEFIECLEGGEGTAVLACSGDEHLLFRGIGLHARGRWMAGLWLAHDAADFAPVYRDIETVFDLTPAEHRIVGLIVAGKTVQQIAAAADIAPGTVRTHIRKVYLKIGVSSREGLLYRLSPFRIC